MSTENDKFAVAETRPKTKINDVRRSKYKNGRLTTKRSKKTTRLSHGTIYNSKIDGLLRFACVGTGRRYRRVGQFKIGMWSMWDGYFELNMADS